MRRVVLALLGVAACHSPEGSEAPRAVAALPSTYQALIAPLLAERCSPCHGAERAKGALRLHTPDAIRAGGESGPALIAGAAASSELVRRINLPLSDDEHMPPDDKPQLDPLERALIFGWIQAGAPFDGRVESLHASQSATATLDAPAPIPPAPPAAVAALRAELVHVQPVAAGSNGLWIDFAAVAPRADDAFVTRLLEPLREQVIELDLARSAVGDGTLALCAALPRLRHLDLRDVKVGDVQLARLKGHAALEELVLARSAITDASLDTLFSLPALRHVFVWKCALSPEALTRLRAKPGLAVDAGDTPDAAVAEAEPPPVLSSDAPIPGAPPPGDPSAPVNATCPVTGSPVNAKYTRTFEGRVIGFCCPNCPGEFDKDPAKYAGKLP